MTETVVPSGTLLKSRVVLGAMKRLGLAAVAAAPKLTQIASVPLLITVTMLLAALWVVAAVVAWEAPLDVISSLTAR